MPNRQGQDGITGADRLLEWFAGVRRDLPWRADDDPWRVWVAEVMLQQTRVERVREYFSSFLEVFPTVETCAEAEPHEVLAAWSGLGYYRRARMLHAGARTVAASGRWPRGYAAWRALPGVGDYTAAALASRCDGQVVAAIDGNVARVVGRQEGLQGPLDRSGRRQLQNAALALLDEQRPGDSNQALIELGALVCLPQRPRCEECPLGVGCVAAASKEPASYGPRRGAPARVAVTLLVAVVERGGSVLLRRRSEDQRLLAGLWELPWCEVPAAEAAAALGVRYGGCWTLERPLGVVRHQITHRSITVEVVAARCNGEAELVEVSRAELQRFPLPSVVAKCLALAGPLPAGRSGSDQETAGAPSANLGRRR